MSLLGKRLKLSRQNKNLTQIEAANKLGISNGTLSGYERNYRDPDTTTLEKMAGLYEVNVDYLLGRSDDPSSTPKNPSGGRAFLGGASNYTEEELEVANAAAQAAVEALRKARANKKQS